jgi:holin-like protein
VRDALLTLATLLLFGSLGGIVKTRFGLLLPGPVIGLLLIAAALTVAQLRSQRLSERLHAASAPSAHRLLAHMGLLFVPPGAGIITEFPALRHAGVALGVGVVASALVGVAVTYATMRAFARRDSGTAEERARVTAC